MVSEEDMRAQLQRLYNLAKHKAGKVDPKDTRTFEEGQMNAILAVAISFGLEVKE